MNGIQRVSVQTKEAILFGEENHWKFRVVGGGGMISQPVVKDDWLFVPFKKDKSIIPSSAIKRADALVRKGYRIQGAIVAHEAPKLLSPPAQVKPEPKTPGLNFPDILMEIIGILGFFLDYLINIGDLIDPALIVVMDDGTWVEVMRWYE